MSSLNSILNPQENYERGSSQDISTTPSRTIPSPASTCHDASAEEPVHYARKDPSNDIHVPHPDCPDTLACLPNSDGRPQHTLPVILRCAILGSTKKRLTIREIYAAMEEKYPYYKTAGPTWKQSVRHHLSLNRLFERQPRPVTDPGFGSYWTVNLSAPPGTKRPRKRGRSNKDAQEDAQPVVMKKRGRPRKENSQFGLPPFTTLSHVGRTLKKCKVSALRTGGDPYDEDEDELLEVESRPFSEDDCESEDDNQTRVAHGAVYSTTRDSKGPPEWSKAMTGSTRRSSIDDSEAPDTTIDRLKIEMAGLKRQSADAVAVSLRMRDQLAEAQADACRAKAALKAMENMLEEEARNRREAERMAVDEANMRHAAEEKLMNLRKA